MKKESLSVNTYLNNLAEDKKDYFLTLRDTISKHLPKGYIETMNYGMVSYVIPHSLYPKGYHCDPKLPLPFISIACQKNFIAIYHMGIYANPNLYNWFTEEYKKQVPTKIDIGKSCIRFKKPNEIPHKLIAELCKKITVKEWIELYEKQFVKQPKAKK